MASSRERVVRVSLRGLFPQAKFFGADDLWVQSCTSDADRCRSGDLFVAVDSGARDGHDSASQAVDRGACGVLGERYLPHAAPQCVVDDSRAAFSRLCDALAGYPTDRMTTIGLTGTHGKTTVQWLLASILEQAGHPAGVWGSLGMFDGRAVRRRPIDGVTPDLLARWLGECWRNSARHCVVEASSRSLATRQLDLLRWDVGLVTNCGQDHLNHHGTPERYRAAKERIFSQLKPGGTAVLNFDDAGCRPWLESLDVPVLTFGLRDGADVTGQVIESNHGQQSMLLHLGDESLAVESRMFGEHHLQNCLAAAAAALVLGIEPSVIVRGLEAVDAIPGRLERVGEVTRTAVYTDEARSPQSLALVLSAVRRVTAGRVFVVVGGGYLAPTDRARLGRVAERFADVTVLSSHRLQRKTSLRVIHDLLDGYARPGRAHVMPDRAKAICWALSEAGPQDSVVLVGPQRKCRADGAQPQMRDIDVVRAWQDAFDQASGANWAAA